MKFYFCETCGKRITELDLADGAGKDKKLRGVYCKACSAGVMTLETIPLDERTAKEILKKSGSPPSTDIGPPPAPRTAPETGLRPRADAPPRVPYTSLSLKSADKADPREDSAPLPRRPSPRELGIGAAVLGALLIGMGMLLLGGEKSPAEVADQTGARQEEPGPATPKIPGAKKEFASEPARPEPSPIRPGPPPPEPGGVRQAQEAFDELIRFEGLAPDDTAGKIARVEGFLEKHGQAMVAVRAHALRAQLRRELAAAASPAPAPAPPTPPLALPTPPVPPAPAPPKIEDPKDEWAEARHLYAGFQERLFRELRAGKREQAADSVARAKNVPAMKALWPELDQDALGVGWLGDVEAALPKGLERLKEIDALELIPSKGAPLRIGRRAPFQLQDFKDGKLNVSGQGATLAIALDDLLPTSRLALCLLGMENDGPGLVRRAWCRLLEIDSKSPPAAVDAARAGIEQARAAGAAAEDLACLKRALETFTKGPKEAAAEEMLGRFDSAFEGKEWLTAEAIGKSLLAHYAETAACRKRADLRDRVVSAARKGSPVVEYTLTLQEGRPVPEAGIESYAGTRDHYTYDFHPDRVRKLDAENNAGHSYFPFFRFLLFEREGGPLPNEVQILEARLFLFKSSSYDPYVELRRVLASWVPEELTYNSASKGVKWKTAGGEVADKVAAKFKFAAYAKTWSEFDVTESLREAQKDGKNLGWRLEVFGSESRPRMVNSASFASSRNEDPSRRPKLVLKVRGPKLK